MLPSMAPLLSRLFLVILLFTTTFLNKLLQDDMDRLAGRINIMALVLISVKFS